MHFRDTTKLRDLTATEMWLRTAKGPRSHEQFWKSPKVKFIKKRIVPKTYDRSIFKPCFLCNWENIFISSSVFYLFWKYELSSEVNSQETGFLHPNRSHMRGSICGHNSNPSETHCLQCAIKCLKVPTKLSHYGITLANSSFSIPSQSN